MAISRSSLYYRPRPANEETLALMRRIEALEAGRAKPRKTSRNSHTSPLQAPGGRSGGGKDETKPKKPRRSRPGVSRPLAAEPNEMIVCRARATNNVA